jgi:hypothetical protein
MTAVAMGRYHFTIFFSMTPGCGSKQVKVSRSLISSVSWMRRCVGLFRYYFYELNY